MATQEKTVPQETPEKTAQEAPRDDARFEPQDGKPPERLPEPVFHDWAAI